MHCAQCLSEVFTSGHQTPTGETLCGPCYFALWGPRANGRPARQRPAPPGEAAERCAPGLDPGSGPLPRARSGRAARSLAPLSLSCKRFPSENFWEGRLPPLPA